MGLGKLWDRLVGKQENEQLAEFRDNVQHCMQEKGIEAARMVGPFCEPSDAFLDGLKNSNFRDLDGTPYDIAEAAVFVADTKPGATVLESRAIPFMAAKMDDGSYRLLGLHNVARSFQLSETDGDAARRAANMYRNSLIATNSTQIAQEQKQNFVASSPRANTPTSTATASTPVSKR